MTQHLQQRIARAPSEVIYSANTPAVDGHDFRVSRSSDGQLDVEFSLPGWSEIAPSVYRNKGSSPAPQTAPVVFIVDHDDSARETLEALLYEAGWQAETFASAEEFLSRPRVSCPSCLVLDLTLPDLSALDLQQRLAAERADMPIIFISGRSDVPMSVRAMKAGAIEFLIKPFGDEAILSAIQQAIERSEVAVRQSAELRALRGRYASLSHREREVMALVVSGLMNKQVAGELSISVITVKAHRGQVMRKMRARSLADLVNMATKLPPAQVGAPCDGVWIPCHISS
jgi:FixJ family two-component response regulator